MRSLYAGAFLGPFAGNVVPVLLPTLQGWYRVDVATSALAVTAYMVPFAAAQFGSGAVADRFGRRPVIVTGFVGFALASLAAALAPTFVIFLAARAGQGLANALTTPVLMAVLGDAVESHRLGRALGLFGAVNTAGLFLAPLVAGLCATIDWRLVYVLMAGVSLLLAALNTRRPDPAAVAAPTAARAPLFREISRTLTPRFAALCAAALLGYLSLNGVGFLVALTLAAAYHLGPAQSGLFLSAFGLANMLAAGPTGVAVDRVGSVWVSAAGALVAAGVLALLPFAPSALVVGALLLVGGASVAALWAGLTKLAVEAAPARRATATSVFNAWKFVGYSLAPLVYTPIYVAAGAPTAFALSSAATLLILPCLAATRRPTSDPLPASRRAGGHLPIE